MYYKNIHHVFAAELLNTYTYSNRYNTASFLNK